MSKIINNPAKNNLERIKAIEAMFAEYPRRSSVELQEMDRNYTEIIDQVKGLKINTIGRLKIYHKVKI